MIKINLNQKNKAIFSEDDAKPEGYKKAIEKWKELFGEEFDRTKALVYLDLQDSFYWLMPNGYIYCLCYDGCYIYKNDLESIN